MPRIVVLLLLCAGPLSAQSITEGRWQGAARFADGTQEDWRLELTRRASGLEGVLLVDAGRGLAMQELTGGTQLTFRIDSPNTAPGLDCRLSMQASGGAWVGACHGASGSEAFQLDFPTWLGPPRDDSPRRRARDYGVVVGTIPPGDLNAITDVDGVRVGQVTIREGDDIRTGVTAILPVAGDLYAEPIPAWIHTANGYGKLIGETQVREFGELETPILLTCTLCVWSAARGLAWTLMDGDPGPQHTINPVVGETNDSWVNDMWQDPVQRERVEEALRLASGGPVEEGSVGAGTGTGAFGWKGGIGTSSRRLPASLGGYTVGVLVQTNFGGTLTINGAPVGEELGAFIYRSELANPTDTPEAVPADGGSLMIVVATDAPLSSATVKRLSERAMLGAARAGSFAHNSSGDYVIAFSTAPSVRRVRSDPNPRTVENLLNPQMSPLFAAVVEATEEAIYNAIFKATTVRGRGRVYQAIPLEPMLEVLGRYGAIRGEVRR